MNPDSGLVQQPVADIPPHSKPALLDAHWSSRSAEELRVIVEHGLRDDRFSAAAHELERRARLLSDQADQTVQADRADHRLFARFVFGGLIALGIMGLVIGVFIA